jgi:hypothetical protein
VTESFYAEIAAKSLPKALTGICRLAVTDCQTDVAMATPNMLIRAVKFYHFERPDAMALAKNP